MGRRKIKGDKWQSVIETEWRGLTIGSFVGINFIWPKYFKRVKGVPRKGRKHWQKYEEGLTDEEG